MRDTIDDDVEYYEGIGSVSLDIIWLEWDGESK